MKIDMRRGFNEIAVVSDHIKIMGNELTFLLGDGKDTNQHEYPGGAKVGEGRCFTTRLGWRKKRLIAKKILF